MTTSGLKVCVTSSLDPHGTCNADKDRGPNRVQRHGFELVRWRMSYLGVMDTRADSQQSWQDGGG
jgi:hypothetical protein